MRDEDVLITEYRVTVLGERGQYVFDWVDEKASSVEFLQQESDFDEYSDEVKNLLQRNGVSIVESNEKPSSSTEQSFNPDPKPDPIDGSNSTMMGDAENQDTSNDFKPTDSQSDPDPVGSAKTGSVERGGSEEKSSSENNSPTEQSGKKDSDNRSVERSFIVRMSDPNERRQVINDIKDGNSSAADELELSGPFRVTYKIKSDGIELIHVEDLGTGTSVGNK